MHVKGFTRSRTGAVVNTDTTELELIKQKRQQKKDQMQVHGEIAQLRDLVLELKKRVEKLGG